MTIPKLDWINDFLHHKDNFNQIKFKFAPDNLFCGRHLNTDSWVVPEEWLLYHLTCMKNVNEKTEGLFQFLKDNNL